MPLSHKPVLPPETPTATTPTAPPPFLTAAKAKTSTANYAKRRWHWLITRVTCARRSDVAVACRVNGKRSGRSSYSKLLAALADGRVTISGAR
ncbi:MAG: hypothetical protein QOJ29_3340 [Thermoleophilaceae bacterium]|jgi:hypothetical protein|nr:hypothetical protein [Thermoleophilaceae bacterium]